MFFVTFFFNPRTEEKEKPIHNIQLHYSLLAVCVTIEETALYHVPHISSSLLYFLSPPAQSGKEERDFDLERKRFPHPFFHGFRSQLQPVTQSNHMGESGGVFFYKDICKEKGWKDSMEQNIDWHL